MTQNAKTEVKQLKKNDLLNAMEPGTVYDRESLVDALIDYEFLPSYLDYLLDHFAALGRIEIREGETQKLYIRKATRSNKEYTFTTAYCVINNDGQFDLITKPIEGSISKEDKAEGWSLTENAAKKVATKAAFADYKATLEAIKALAAEDASEEVEESEESEDAA